MAGHCGRAGTECERWPSTFVGDNEQHSFSGYGFWISFHPECCPGWMDGTACRKEHPAGWTPWDGPGSPGWDDALAELPPLGPVPDFTMTPDEALRDHDYNPAKEGYPSKFEWMNAVGNPLRVARAFGCHVGYEAAWLVAFMERNNTMEVL